MQNRIDMKYAGFGVIALVLLVVLSSARKSADHSFKRKDILSEYGFFEMPLSALKPVSDIIPYDLNTPLFSNYAEKLRFVKLPPGTSAVYNDSAVFDFPEGTVLIKNFYYYNDFRKPEKGRKIIETRLLVHEQQGWNAYPYIWNEEQTEAFYDPAGETRQVSYIDKSGKKVKAPYVIPNRNQCKGCHVSGQRMLPIGPAARHLNRPDAFVPGNVNQLTHWVQLGILSGLPDLSQVPALPVWNDPDAGSLDARARAYLDINCAHCHNRKGPASTSGLFLDVYERNKAHLGINKSPVAAGRGSGNLRYDIVPGQPGQSILVFRMNTTDPAIAMPEIGREQVHREGIALIEEWIRNMPVE